MGCAWTTIRRVVALAQATGNRVTWYRPLMVADVHAASDFYATARGGVAARLLRARLGALWPEVRGEAILGIGYAAPYLRLWREHAARCLALTPAQVGVARWPAGKANLSCTAEEDCLPFPDLCFDRILLVHGLEAADNARRLLREVWNTTWYGSAKTVDVHVASLRKKLGDPGLIETVRGVGLRFAA